MHCEHFLCDNISSKFSIMKKKKKKCTFLIFLLLFIFFSIHHKKCTRNLQNTKDMKMENPTSFEKPGKVGENNEGRKYRQQQGQQIFQQHRDTREHQFSNKNYCTCDKNIRTNKRLDWNWAKALRLCFAKTCKVEKRLFGLDQDVE